MPEQAQVITSASGVQIDTIQANDGVLTATGPVAMRLLESNFNINALRTNTVLRKEEWELLDGVLIEIARRRLVGVSELMSRNLRFDIANGLGTTILEWEQVSDMTPADVSMSGVTEGERDRIVFALQSMPLPIIHKDFNINIRTLEASRKLGQALDVAQVAMATTLVSEAIESMLFLGNAMTVGGKTIAGLLTEGNRNTGSVSANWDSAATGAQMLADIISMIDALTVDNMYGPYGLFVPQAAWNRMMDDFKSNSDKSILTRLMETPGLEFILPSKDVTAGAIVMVQLTSDVVDEVVGLEPTLVQWDVQGGMQMNFKVMAIMIPRVRSTKSNQSGVAHFS